MKVLKFGGTSVGSAQRMKDVANLIVGEKNIIVLSAMSGTTNSLVEISDYLYKKNPDGANEIINNLLHKYLGHIEELYSTEEYKQKARELVMVHFDHIRSFTKDLFTLFEEKVVLAQGELMSTGMMDLYLKERGVHSVMIPALDYMRTDKNAEPDPVYIKEKLLKLLDEHPEADLYITQGYICRNAYGEIDNLQRGGSDYSASERLSRRKRYRYGPTSTACTTTTRVTSRVLPRFANSISKRRLNWLISGRRFCTRRVSSLPRLTIFRYACSIRCNQTRRAR